MSASWFIFRMGADVDVVIEDVSLSGRAQIVIEMDHLVPFPHMKSVAVTFLERYVSWYACIQYDVA